MGAIICPLLDGFSTDVLCSAAGPRIDPNTATAILGGMLGVSAMAVQNALVQVSLKGAPSTAVMTTNVTRFMMDLGEMLLGRDTDEVARARRRANHTWPAIVGFAVGCGVGAAGEGSIRTVVFDALHRTRPARACDWSRGRTRQPTVAMTRIALAGVGVAFRQDTAEHFLGILGRNMTPIWI